MSTAKKSTKKPEIWGGIECSFNRVKDQYMDQLYYSGHYTRIIDDITAIAALGIKAMRYPLIWERLIPSPRSDIDWSLTDVALNALQQHGIQTIAGLVHHGSGPRYADLLSHSFATGLSEFAGNVARRYPWIEYYTPVNEPLTTARFCALYGLWYPHRKSDRAFALAFVNEIKAVVLSMQAIRKINPGAKLIQTEDLAKIYSTPKLQYQADFENHRRWLSWDFLTGKVNREHPMWEYFVQAGIPVDTLMYFIDNPCPPDIIGVDYYPTSERYLDENLDKYPMHTHGANHTERYADVEAVRVRHGQPCGIKLLLQECWERYHLPIAVTEAHINCDFDNQVRWFSEIRHVCSELMNEGVDIRAVTGWALLGSFGWNSLLTRVKGDYESGVFDVRSGSPIPTPMADYLRCISTQPDYVHPAEHERGWWHQDDRFLFERQDELVAEDTSPEDGLSALGSC